LAKATVAMFRIEKLEVLELEEGEQADWPVSVVEMGKSNDSRCAGRLGLGAAGHGYSY
jgi:hypothetical protein